MFESRAREAAEYLLMHAEDLTSKALITAERSVLLREMTSMRREDVNLNRNSKKEGSNSPQPLIHLEESILIPMAIQKAVTLTQTRQYAVQHTKELESLMKSETTRQLNECILYEGPPSGAPVKPSLFTSFALRRRLHQELKESFVNKLVNYELKRNADRLHIEDTLHLQQLILHQLIEDEVQKEIHFLVMESVEEDREAKVHAEHSSGLVVPQPASLHFHAYLSLIDLKKRHKKELKTKLQLVEGNKSIKNRASSFIL